jgi:hypothetical protein
MASQDGVAPTPMSEDLVWRLRNHTTAGEASRLCEEAADEIERLHDQLKEMTELRAFDLDQCKRWAVKYDLMHNRVEKLEASLRYIGMIQASSVAEITEYARQVLEAKE